MRWGLVAERHRVGRSLMGENQGEQYFAQETEKGLRQKILGFNWRAKLEGFLLIEEDTNTLNLAEREMDWHIIDESRQ